MNNDRNLSKKAIDLAERNIVVLDESTIVADAAKEMRNKGIMSVLVSRNRSCVGIVTEKDMLYRVLAENRGPFKTILREIMSTPLITIDGGASVKDAVEMMRMKSIRRLPVTIDRNVIGILTLRSVIGNSKDHALELAEVQLPGDKNSGIACPYCGSGFKDKDELSKHIDRLHLGSGLLEGDLRQW